MKPVRRRVGLGPATWALGLCASLACALRRPPPPGASGAQIYELQNCANCHGEEGAGTSRGPALRELSRHWTRERLVDYLADPQAVAAVDPRLRARGREFSSEMGPYDNLTAEQRGVLADWLLAR